MSGQTNLDSTELLKPHASAWEVIIGGELTSPRRGLRAATLNNKIFVTGKREYISTYVLCKERKMWLFDDFHF